jgi:hypothetical protein
MKLSCVDSGRQCRKSNPNYTLKKFILLLQYPWYHETNFRCWLKDIEELTQLPCEPRLQPQSLSGRRHTND